MTVRTKICGITSSVDALACVGAGVDALGFVFYAPSSRYIAAETAANIIRQLPPFITTVGLFMNATENEVRQVLKTCRLDRLQFHGSESGKFCTQFDVPYFKAIAMGDAVQDFKYLMTEYSTSSAFLLDSHRKDQAGGSGSAFDWVKVPSNVDMPLILAGGLNPDNVQSAIERVRPYAVDCSSGVESEPGVKDHAKIRQFVENVTNASTS